MTKKLPIVFSIVIAITSAIIFTGCSAKGHERGMGVTASKSDVSSAPDGTGYATSYGPVEFKDSIADIPNNIKELVFKDFSLDDTNPKIKKSEDKEQIKIIENIIKSKKWNKLTGSWAIKSSPEHPYYSITLVGDNELTINFGGDLGSVGYIALLNGTEMSLYEVPLDVYNQLLTNVK